MELHLEYFMKLRNLIYERTGISFEANKIYYIKKRLQQRMDACGLAEIDEYIKHLKLFDRDGREFQELMNLMTVITDFRHTISILKMKLSKIISGICFLQKADGLL